MNKILMLVFAQGPTFCETHRIHYFVELVVHFHGLIGVRMFGCGLPLILADHNQHPHPPSSIKYAW